MSSVSGDVAVPIVDLPDGGVALVMATAKAYALDLASVFSDALIERGLIERWRRAALLIALNEALANGIMHGNLELSSDGELTPESFLAQASLITERLASAEFGRRSIALQARSTGIGTDIAIRDEGGGFTPPMVSAASARPALSGRGLGLMEENCDSIRYEDGGRCVVLSFLCTGGVASDGA